DHLDVAGGVLDPRRGVRREVRVLGEDALRRHELADLHEPAGLADAHVQRVESLSELELGGTHDVLAQRREAKGDAGPFERAAAEAAARRAPQRFARRPELLQSRHRHLATFRRSAEAPATIASAAFFPA